MPLRKFRFRVYLFVAIPVTLIVLGAGALSAAAVKENLLFINSTNQILGLVSTVRMVAGGQTGFAQTPGEDIWADLEHAGQLTASTTPTNPWHGNLGITAGSSTSMRVENDLPTHECRRLALYFLNLQPTDLGLVGIEAQSAKTAIWMPVYPSVISHEKAVGIACGNAPTARLALIFKMR